MGSRAWGCCQVVSQGRGQQGQLAKMTSPAITRRGEGGPHRAKPQIPSLHGRLLLQPGREAGEPFCLPRPWRGVQAGPPFCTDSYAWRGSAHLARVHWVLCDATYPSISPLLRKGHKGHVPLLKRGKLRLKDRSEGHDLTQVTQVGTVGCRVRAPTVWPTVRSSSPQTLVFWICGMGGGFSSIGIGGVMGQFGGRALCARPCAGRWGCSSDQTQSCPP